MGTLLRHHKFFLAVLLQVLDLRRLRRVPSLICHTVNYELFHGAHTAVALSSEKFMLSREIQPGHHPSVVFGAERCQLIPFSVHSAELLVPRHKVAHRRL